MLWDIGMTPEHSADKCTRKPAVTPATVDMSVEIAGVQLANPTLTASGTCGYALEYAPHTDLSHNVESVFLPPGEAGAVEITVTASSITGDGVPNIGGLMDQDFALLAYNVEAPPRNPINLALVLDESGSMSGTASGGTRPKIDVLKDAGVEIMHELPGVGENLQDHLEVYFQFHCKQPITLNGKLDLISKGLIGARWLLFKDGLGSTNHFESGGFIRSKAGLKWPDIQYHFRKD